METEKENERKEGEDGENGEAAIVREHVLGKYISVILICDLIVAVDINKERVEEKKVRKERKVMGIRGDGQK